MNQQELIRAALEARKRSYSPYSGFQVGAALLARDGRIFTGCNIENAGYSSTICAERTAIFKAVSEGVRNFAAIAIAGGPGEGEQLQYCAPCGDCRQVMMEYFDPETFQIILGKSQEDYRQYTLKELLPLGFGPENLGKERMCDD